MKTNRLATEKSPYLLQHQYNPVEWHPWGEAAFEKARAEQKPIFLSIGYSTCHWCHVMEHESFENEETAALLNKYFVSIKVDREERPDVDRIYMTYVQASTGSGGWPMSVFLTPTLQPFFGGTYFPPVDRWGKAGFPTIIERLAELWQGDRPRLLAHSEAATESLRESQAAPAPLATEPSRLHPHLIEGGYEQIAQSYDGDYAGFSHAPKFPRPVTIDFLLRYAAGGSTPADSGERTSSARRHARDMALETLDAMAKGGIYDHLGGGFHRYSVDRTWHISHYEKMLYDQAQLVMAYTDAYQLTRSPLYAATIRGTLGYVLLDMTSPGGAFFSAEDADSLPAHDAKAKVEGAFYVWEKQEITALLAEPVEHGSSMTDGDLFSLTYGVEPNGNAPEGSDPHGEFTNKNALIQRTTAEALSTETGLSLDVVESSLAKSRATLLAARTQRPRPHLDDKILTAWNGLMISAFTRAGSTLSEPAYLEAAARAATFIRKELWDGTTLLRSYREGASNIHAFADDYAYLIQGVLDLYEATGQLSWLEWATRLQAQADLRFLDSEHGGYFSTEADAPNLLFRVKEDYDGAEPSPNSVFALNLLRLADLTNSDAYRQQAESLLNCFILQLTQRPSAVPLMLSAADRALASSVQYQLIGKGTESLQATLAHYYRPNKSILHIPDETARQWLLPMHPTLEHLDLAALAPSILICENQACLAPIRDAEALAAHLQAQQSSQQA